MEFKSDNASGVPHVMFEAMVLANEGAVSAYGDDPWTKQVEKKFSEIFEREVVVSIVSTGTAANSLGLALYSPPWGGVVCHHESHIMVDECAAPEFYSGGVKLIGVEGAQGKMTPESVNDALYYMVKGDQHSIQPSVLSLTQVTEAGTVYSLEEIRALSDVAASRDLKMHMDGARFGNALMALGCSPADMTWKSGIDVLSFGATKGGALAAEAVILFDAKKADELMYRRKRAGHLLSKSRFAAAQLLAYLDNDLWLKSAAHANAMSARLAQGISRSNKLRHAFDVDANMQFVIMTIAVHEWLQSAGAHYYLWPGRGPRDGNAKHRDEVIARFVCGFATTQEEVDEFVAVVGLLG